jgi:hypothetical protein
MKDDSPRLFRALEKTAGRDGFDTIVSAAVASYGSLRSPGDNQARDFGRLVVPLWDKIQPETRRALAAALSHSPRVPRPIVELLIAEPLEISAPFLMSSPALGATDLLALRTSRDRRLRKIIAGRAASGATASADAPAPDAPSPQAPSATAEPVAAAPAAAAPPAPAAAAPATPAVPAGRVAPEQPVAARPSETSPASVSPPEDDVPAPLPAPTGAADLIRETLRRLALPGGRDRVAPTLHELVALAVQQDGARFYEGLRQALDLADEVLQKIADDESGERLAVAIKALGATPADALTILMMLKPDIGLDVTKFSLMTRFYRALKAEDCAALARGPRARRTVAAPRLEPQYEDLQPLPRTAPPADFGRRVQRPFGEQKGFRSG